MSEFELLEVSTKEQERQFIDVSVQLYANDRNWIRPLDDDIQKVFSDKNRFYRNGKTKRWLAIRKGKLIGRIAAFHSKEFSFKGDYKTGGVGFFESINDQSVSDALFNAACDWLKSEGIGVVDGPINLGERNAWWGVLVDGFDEPVYQMNYNFPYYKDLFESYGFQLYFKQFSYGLPLGSNLGEKYYTRGKRILSDPDYEIRSIEKSNLEKYAEDFRTVYNKAWVKHEGFDGMTKAKSRKILNSMKPILDEDLIWFTYYKDDPILAFIAIPDLNQYFKHVNGKMNLLGKAKYM